MKLLDQSAKTNWKFIAIVAFVAVFLAGGILMLIPQFQEPTPPLSQQNTSQLDTSDFTLSGVEGWQTYRSDEFGFEVKYSEDKRILRLDAVGTGFASPDLVFSLTSKIANYPESYTGIYVYTSKDTDKVGQCSMDSSGKKYSKTKDVNGVTFFVVQENMPDDAMGGMRSLNDMYKVLDDNVCYTITSSVFWRSIEFVHGVADMQKSTSEELVEEQNWIQTQKQVNDEILATFRFVMNNQPEKCRGIADIDERISCWLNTLGSKEKEAVFQCGSAYYSDACYSQIGTLKNDMEVCEKAGMYSYTCKIQVAQQNPPYSSEEAKAIIADRAGQVVRALKEKDMKKLASFVHPEKPLRFWSINAGFELPKEKIPSFFTDPTEHTGSYDGSGLPFTFTQTEYYERYMYDRDYLNAPDVSYEISYFSSATTLGDQFDRYHEEGPVTATYAFLQSSPDAASDWRNLRLWFTQENDVWYLREIMQNQWAI